MVKEFFKGDVLIRFTIVTLVVILYLIIAISIRPVAYSENWNRYLQSLLGCVPNFLACIGLVNLFKIFYPNKNTIKLILICALTLILYELFSGSSRKTGIGITYDFLDIVATVSGAIVVYFMELKFDFQK